MISPTANTSYGQKLWASHLTIHLSPEKVSHEKMKVLKQFNAGGPCKYPKYEALISNMNVINPVENQKITLGSKDSVAKIFPLALI